MDYAAEVFDIPQEVRGEMLGRSYQPVPACPAFEALRLLRLRHHDFGHDVRWGELIVAAHVADTVVEIFRTLFDLGFPIANMQRVEAFDGDDEASMAANNSSAFNFRVVAGSDTLSHHALGVAIDLNPVQNPWLHAGRVDPPAGRTYLDRSHVRPGMIVRGGGVVEAFESHGWHWGGEWPDAQDYHHFSALPR